MMDGNSVFVRVNGRGNAWPVFVGTKHPFYDGNTSEDLANASFSIFGCSSQEFSHNTIDWSVLIDAGNHTTPYIIKNENRIPEAIFLTHPHMDHTLGVDWIAQSRYYLSGKQERYPVYGTSATLAVFRQAYPHLKKVVDCRELRFGIKTPIDEVKGLHVTAFPVYHGPGGLGASMLFFEVEQKKKYSLLFTGDMLCPLIRKKDYQIISAAQMAFIDSNNRYSYPLSNHSSFTKKHPEGNDVSPYLEEWIAKTKLQDLIKPHQHFELCTSDKDYLKSFFSNFNKVDELPLSIKDFAKKTSIPVFNLVHYGAFEDLNEYGTEVLSDSQLETWANDDAKSDNLNCQFKVPRVGDLFPL